MLPTWYGVNEPDNYQSKAVIFLKVFVKGILHGFVLVSSLSRGFISNTVTSMVWWNVGFKHEHLVPGGTHPAPRAVVHYLVN